MDGRAERGAAAVLGGGRGAGGDGGPTSATSLRSLTVRSSAVVKEEARRHSLEVKSARDLARWRFIYFDVRDCVCYRLKDQGRRGDLELSTDSSAIVASNVVRRVDPATARSG